MKKMTQRREVAVDVGERRPTSGPTSARRPGGGPRRDPGANDASMTAGMTRRQSSPGPGSSRSASTLIACSLLRRARVPIRLAATGCEAGSEERAQAVEAGDDREPLLISVAKTGLIRPGIESA